MKKVIVEICLTEARKTSVKEAIKAGYFNIWTPDRIKGAFSAGHGTMQDFNRYKRENAPYCIIKELSFDDLVNLYPGAVFMEV